MSEQTYSCTVSEKTENYSKTLLSAGIVFLLASLLLVLVVLQMDNTVLKFIAGYLAVSFAASAALAFWTWRNSR